MRAISFVLVFVLAFSAAQAQSPSAQARRDALAKIQEVLADPDPLMRIANLEEIIAEGDAIKIQTAVQIAFAGNDPVLRGLAFRAYLGGVRSLVFDMALPPDMQKTLAQKRAEGPEQEYRFLSNYSLMKDLLGSGMRTDLQIKSFDMTKGVGTLTMSVFALKPVEFRISGEKLVAQSWYGQDYNTCVIELRPNRNLTLTGSVACLKNTFGNVSLSGSLF